MKSEWQSVKLGDVAEINPPRIIPRGKEALFLAMDDLEPWKREVSSWQSRLFSGSGARFQDGDTLMARITPCLENGKTVYVNFLHKGEVGHGSTEFIVLTGREDITDNLFIYYLVRSEEFRDFAIQRMEGSSGRQRVPAPSLENYEFNLPPLIEQSAVSSMLGALDDKIELNRKINQHLEALAHAIFAREFPYTPEHELPNGWHVVALPGLFEVNPRRSLPPGTIAPYLEMANMPTSSARALAWEMRPAGSGMRFINGDVLVARITPCLENGKTAFVDFLPDGQVGWGSTEYIVLRSKPPIPLECAYLLARTDDFRAHVIQNMTGTSDRQRANADCLSQYEVVRPPDDLLSKLGRQVNTFFRAMKANDDESRTLAALRNALLPKLLSGELRVPQAEKLVEATT